MHIGPSSVHIVARVPKLVPPADPVKTPKKPSANVGASIANSGVVRQQRQDKGLEEGKARHDHQPEAKQEKAGQTKPTGRFHLPGVEPRNAEQAEEGHADGQGVGDYPNVGGD